MDPFDLISRYFWILALASGLQYLRPSPDLRERLIADEAFAAEHRTLRRRLFALMSAPWLIVGAGQLADHVPSIWYYFRPADGNPYVVSFWGCILGCQILVAAWVYLGDGARIVAEHKLMTLHVFGHRVALSASHTKVVIGLVLLAGAAGLVTLAMSDVPIPRIAS